MTEKVVSIDRYLYERILFNLLSNAVKFTPSGGEVSVSLKVEGDRLRLAVEDTGIGIAESDLSRLFQKFRQVDSSSTRRFEGAGLGLALVKEFAQMLGGDVSVESQRGKGSLFTVECLAPRTEASPLASEASRPSVPVRLVEQYGYAFQPEEREKKEGERKLLIAEDNLELASYMADVLRNLCQVKIARDGEEALQMAREWNPDLVISDVMMPRRDGLSFCREMKAVPETRDIPFILLTALTYREALLRGWEAGADDYLFKPFHPKELLTRVRSILVSLEAVREVKQVKSQAEERLRIIESTPNAMVMVGKEGKISLLNRQAESLFGYSREELLGQTIEMLVPERFRSKHPGYRSSFFADPKARPMGAGRDLFGLKKDGTEVPIEIGLNPIETPEGLFTLASIIDITERKRAEERLRLIIEASPNGMIMVGREGKITLVNRQAEALFGYSREELIGQRIEKLVPERFRSQHPGYRQGFFHDPKVRPMGAGRDLFGLKKDGTEVPIEIGLNPLETTEGVFTLASIIDITERKRAEEETARIVSIVESSDDAIIGKTLEGMITSWNRGAEQLYGYKREEVIDKSISLLIPPGHEDDLPHLLRQLKHGEHIKQYETSRLRKDGTLVDVAITVSPIVNPAGRVVGASVTARDITEHKRAEALAREKTRLEVEMEERKRTEAERAETLRGLEQSQEAALNVLEDFQRENTERKRAEEKLQTFAKALEHSNKELEEFAYVVSHDLKAPLRGISSLSQWIVEDSGKRLDEKGRENLKKLQGRVLWMGNLIDGILEYSRIVRVRGEIKEVDLGKLVKEVIGLINPPPHIHVKVSKSLPRVSAEEIRLRQLFQNLLSNACRYADPRKGEVLIESSEKDDHWEFRISDNGPGIERKYHERIFQMFQTLEPEEKGGTGIGLSIAKKIVALNGGQIWVDSEPSHGATFIFTLPREKVKVPAGVQ